MKEELAKAPKSCKFCGDSNWVIKEMIDSAGRVRYPYVCAGCRKRSTAFCKKKLAEKSDLLIKGAIKMRQKTGACERCGTVTYLEKHHWAPFSIFGDDAINWPTSMLCRSCHEEWHQKVTGHLIKKKLRENVREK